MRTHFVNEAEEQVAQGYSGYLMCRHLIPVSEVRKEWRVLVSGTLMHCIYGYLAQDVVMDHSYNERKSTAITSWTTQITRGNPLPSLHGPLR